MKRLAKSIRLVALIAVTLMCYSTGRAQTATWSNSGGDNDWNNALNWDIGVPAAGTNAVIGAGNTVNYNAPMTATSFEMLDLSSAVLNVNAAGFFPAASDSAISISSVSPGNNFPANGLYIGNGGVVSITNGNLVLTNNSVVSIAAGGSLRINGTLQVGGVSGNNDLRVCVTNRGGMLSALTTTLNPNNAAGASQANLGAALYILGGTNDLGDVTIRRAPAAGTEANDVAGKQGLVISNGLVRTTSLDVGGPNGNSWLTMLVAGGTVTNSGNFTVRTTGTANRGSRFHQFGGLFVSPGTNNVHLRGQTAQNGLVTYTVVGATNIVNGFVLADATDTVGTVNMTNAGKIYISSGGMTMEGSLTATNVMLNNGGVFGATADWTGTAPIVLNGGTIDAADLGGTPRNISLSGVLRGAGALNKSGGGTLTLNAANIYSGNTLINAGTLALGAAGSIASSPQIIVASGATFDVSAISGFTMGGSRTLSGSGTVVGDLTLASGGIMNPGTTSGTLTLSNALTETGGAINHFDLPAFPGPGNDLLIVNGALNVSGVNTIEIVGGGSVGTVHTLIQYGSFNGSVANFTLAGTSGIVSNNPTTKTISLIVQSSVRNPTNVVWVGNASANDWDTVNRTNWLNTGTGLIDYFVTGDNALFNNTGAANPHVNIVGNNAPTTLTVGASANYVFGGSGVISGSAGLTKTNTGTVTITNLNSYSGVTLLGGGVIEAATLANGGNPSSIGAASSDPNNLVFGGGTLRYTGPTIDIERGGTFNAGGGAIEVTDSGATLTASGSLAGSGGFTKAGGGTLTLPVANSYAGGTVVSNGTLRVNAPGAAGSGMITLAGGTLFLGMPADNDLLNPIAVTSPSSLVMGGLNNRVNGAISGSHTLSVTVNSGLVLTFNGNMTNYAGTYALGSSAGTFRLNSGGGNATFGFPNATMDLGDSTAILQARNPGTMNVGALRGGPGTSVRGPGSTDGTLIWQIGSSTNEPSSTFDGTFADASGARIAALSKVGPGTLRLTGNSTHTGATTVNEGALQMDGSFAAGSVTVFGTLTGNGTFGGNVDIQPGGRLSPGTSIGVMTINNFLTLQPGSTNFMELHKSAGTNDSIVGLTSVSYGGTLVVTNLNGTLAGGDTFKLFDAVPGSYGGAFDTIILPTVSAPLVWDTSGLTVDGTLRLVVPGVARPTISTATIEGTTFVLRGTNNGNTSTHYYVLTTTNVATPLANWIPVVTNQFEVDGSFAVTNAFSPGEPRRFYLLQTP